MIKNMFNKAKFVAKSSVAKGVILATAVSSTPAFAAVDQTVLDAQQILIIAGVVALGTLGVIVHLSVKSFKDGRKALG